jgi:hypothetical protein
MNQSTSPQAPIVVLGKNNDYVFAARTVTEAVSNTNRYLTGSTKEQRVLVLRQLDFYDAAGRQLEQILAAGKLEDLAVKDLREEIRGRVQKVFSSLEPEVQQEAAEDPDFDNSDLELPEQPLDFETFAYRLALVMAEEDTDSSGPGVMATSTRRGWLYRAVHRKRK